MTTVPCTFYGVLNGSLTTSKNCRRAAVHAAVEADGFVWGVATADGTLMVINRSEALAAKWLADWGRDGYSVVKVYAGKAAAEAACQPAEAPEAAPAAPKPAKAPRLPRVRDLKVGQTVQFKNGETMTILSIKPSGSQHGFACMTAKIRLDNGDTTTRTWPKSLSLAGCIVSEPEDAAPAPETPRWVPACGGTERWATARDGREYLYVWWSNAPESTPAAERHGWLDRSDIIRHDDPNG